MFKEQMLKFLLKLSLFFSLLLVPAAPALSSDLTQRDWLITLTDALGWSYGLPDEPQDPDYINIMTGNREFRFEAEDIYDKDRDNVSVMSFRNFGDFSGKGWLNGSRTATDVHFEFNLPIGGTYKVSTHIRKTGHRFNIHGETVPLEAGETFTKKVVGTYHFDAGPQQITLSLPAGGSIDYISLSAPNLALITPESGWDPEAPLTWEVINTTLRQLLKLADIFPLAEAPLEIEAEDFIQNGTKAETATYLGRPSEGKWLRVGTVSAEVKIPLKKVKAGFYNMTLRLLGDKIKVVIGDHHSVEIDGKAFLDNYTFPAIYFTGSENNISLTLPAGGGIDQIVFTRNLVDLPQVATLLNISQTAPPGADDLNDISKLLAAFGVDR